MCHGWMCIFVFFFHLQKIQINDKGGYLCWVRRNERGSCDHSWWRIMVWGGWIKNRAILAGGNYWTVPIIKDTTIAHVLPVINNFHKNVEFTYEMEENGKITLLDILIIRNNNTLKTTVFINKTHNCLHWKSFEPPTWKCSTITFNNYKSLQNLLNSRISRSRIIGNKRWVYPNQWLSKVNVW